MANSAKSLMDNNSQYGVELNAPHSASELNSARAVAENASKSAYRNSWIAENLDRINLTMPKGKKEQVKAVAERLGMSLNAYINLAVDERIEKDT